MTAKPSRDRLRVIAMVQAAEEAKRDAAIGKETFMAPGLTQKAVLLDLIRLTESAEKVSSGLKGTNPKIPWERLSRLRNRGLVHDYNEVDLEEIWSFVRNELPRIRRQLDRLSYPSEGDT
jgi:uncharacterized protein with HEPN domain